MSDGALLDRDALMAQEPDLPRLERASALLETHTLLAIKQLEDLADQGSVMSMLYLAQTYLREPNPDRSRARRWYVAAYERGSSTALFGLGAMYYTEENYIEAEKIFSEGVTKNDGVSMYWLASVYIADKRHYGKVAEIKDLLERSAGLGQIKATHELSLRLLKGRYGVKEIPRGLFLYVSNLIDAFVVAYRDPSSRRLW